MLALGTLALTLACFERMDYGWFSARLVATHPLLQHLGGAGLPKLDRQLVMAPAAISAALKVVVGWIVVALYVGFLGAAARRPLKSRQALAVAAWAQVPYIVALVPSAINLATHGDGRLAPEQLDPTTFSALFGLQGTSFIDLLALHIGLADLWAWALLVAGMCSAAGLHARVSVAAICIPAVLFNVALSLATMSFGL